MAYGHYWPRTSTRVSMEVIVTNVSKVGLFHLIYRT